VKKKSNPPLGREKSRDKGLPGARRGEKSAVGIRPGVWKCLSIFGPATCHESLERREEESRGKSEGTKRGEVAKLVELTAGVINGVL